MCKKWKVFILIFCLIFTMMPITVFAAETVDDPSISQQGQTATTLTLYYQDKNTSDNTDFIDIDRVEYDDNLAGEDITQGYEITFDDDDFIEANPIKFSIADYVPDRIIDKDNVTWVLNDKGDGQQKIEIHKGDKITQIFHYKKGESEPPAATQGGITITKVVTGDRPSSAAIFTFAITGDDYSGRASITGEGDTTLNNLEPGAYTITEGNIDNYAPKLNDQVVNVVAGTVAAISFENVYTDPNPPSATSGSITIKKVIYRNDEQRYDPDPDNPPVFTFTVSLLEGKSDTVKITGAGIVTLDDLVPGEYTVTEVDDPYDDFRPDTEPQTFILNADDDKEVVFTNIYFGDDEPSVRINKTVAEYDGSNMPNSTEFKKDLSLTELNKKVIYKIELTCDSELNQAKVRLKDIYEEVNITNNLLVLKDGDLIPVVLDDEYPGNIDINYETIDTFYYVDTLTSYDTYTNIAYLYEPIRERATSGSDESDPIASSSAVVVVDYIPPSDNGGGGSSHSHSYYYVTYDANFPVSTGTSGTVPVDNSKYSKGATVTVKDNSGDLKAGDYTFEGWNTRADGTGTAYDPADTFKISSNVTLYAQWKNGTTPLPDNSNDNGTVTASEVVPVNQLDDVPKTGDSAPLLPMMLLGALSAAVLLMFGRNKTADQK